MHAARACQALRRRRCATCRPRCSTAPSPSTASVDLSDDEIVARLIRSGASADGPSRCCCCSSCAGSTCGRSTTSPCGTAGHSSTACHPRPKPSRCWRSATRTGPSVPSPPCTARGGAPQPRPAPVGQDAPRQAAPAWAPTVAGSGAPFGSSSARSCGRVGGDELGGRAVRHGFGHLLVEHARREGGAQGRNGKRRGEVDGGCRRRRARVTRLHLDAVGGPRDRGGAAGNAAFHLSTAAAISSTSVGVSPAKRMRTHVFLSVDR